jgi:hypothetical protein
MRECSCAAELFSAGKLSLVGSMIMKTLAWSLILAPLCFIGCAPGNAPAVVGKSAAIATSTPQGQFPQLRWSSLEADGNESESTGGPVSASEKGFQIVAEKFQQLAWNRPLSKPSISIALTEERSLTIRLSADSTSDHPEFIAIRWEPGPTINNATTTAARRSQPIKDAPQALALLRAYTQDDGTWESLVAWAEQDDSPSTTGD